MIIDQFQLRLTLTFLDETLVCKHVVLFVFPLPAKMEFRIIFFEF